MDYTEVIVDVLVEIMESRDQRRLDNFTVQVMVEEDVTVDEFAAYLHMAFKKCSFATQQWWQEPCDLPECVGTCQHQELST